MTSTTTDVPQSVTHGAIAAALAALRDLLLGGRVIIADRWADTGSGPGVRTGRVLAIEVAEPAQLDAILHGLTQLEGPVFWQGHHHAYRDWTGQLLTMPVVVTQRDDRTLPDATGELVEQVERPVCYGAPDGFEADCRRPGPHALHPLDEPPAAEPPAAEPPADVPEPADPDACSCWATSPNGCPVHYIRDADPAPLRELVFQERYGQAPPVVRGQDRAAHEVLEASYSRYAIARAVCEFGRRRFPTIEDARDAVRYWAGYDMLTAADREAVAEQLVDPRLIPAPVQAGTDRRKFVLLPQLRRRRPADASEVAF